MKNLLYFQSGGPTSVINTSLYGVIKEAKLHPEIGGIYASLYGIEGVLNDNLIDLRAESEDMVELLPQTPGAILGTARYKLSSDVNHPDYQKILATLKKYNIGYLLVNGGNDSMDTCHKLSKLMTSILTITTNYLKNTYASVTAMAICTPPIVNNTSHSCARVLVVAVIFASIQEHS